LLYILDNPLLAEDNDYWCCYTPIDFNITVDISCSGGVGGRGILEYFVFPNPSDKIFSLRFVKPLANDAELTLVNINGEVQSKISLIAGTQGYSMGISELNSGMYFISVNDKLGNKHSERFLKK